MRQVEALALAGALALMWPAAAQSEQPLSIAQQGYFFVGGKYSTVNDRKVMSGQIYVEFQVPRRKTQPYPLVIIQGAAQTGTNFNGTPDGREGWAQYFLRQGYAVYVVEQPGRGTLRLSGRRQRPAGISEREERRGPLHRARECNAVAAGASCTRNGPAPASPAIRCSTSSSRRRCRSCRSRT